MFVGVCRVVLHAPYCHSRKERRAVVRTLVDRVRARFDIKMSEVGGQETWQRIELGFAVVASAQGRADDAIHRVLELVGAAGVARVVADCRDVSSFDGPLAAGAMPVPPEADDWVPQVWAEELTQETDE